VEFPGDPDALDRLAGRIVQNADRIRAEAAALRSRSAAVRWRSTAAAEFRTVIERDAAALDRGACQLDEAAVLLRAHANTVRERLAFLRAAAARAGHDLLHPGDLVHDMRTTLDRWMRWLAGEAMT
jgi:hypothetical protein